ncbi:hypothetical protein AAG906_019681 [Vitis piasezkii]
MFPGRALFAALLCFSLTIQLGVSFAPFNVSYDHRALLIDGKRRMLISAGIHYPRATPEMWPDLIAKSKEGGADVIQTYVFWNGHEPVRRQYNFEGRYDIVKFVKLVGSSGLYLHLRIGPYVCAEWNFGLIMAYILQDEMQRFVKKIVDLMQKEMLFSWQGGPIIMLQIENEYGNVESSFGQRGKDYVKWAARMALELDAGVPWVMCQQADAPDIIRPVEDIAFAVARFFQRGGSFHNYYMYFGGTNFGRSSGGPFYVTSYDYDAPIDEYGLLSQPKWGHLKELHAAIKLCEPALVAVDSPQYIKLGPMQEAHVYRVKESLYSTQSGNGSSCSAFLANIDEHKTASVTFLGQIYKLPPWSVSILPDCRTTVFNTAKVGAQTSIKTVEFDLPLVRNISVTQPLMVQNKISYVPKTWMTLKEPISVWSENNFTIQGVLEHLNVTKDHSDYLWRITSEGSVIGHWVKVVQPIQLLQGYNDLVLLSQTVGLQNYGAFLEKDGAGFKGQVKLTGFKNGEIDLSEYSWTYQVGLRGEFQKIYMIDESEKAEWTDLTPDASPSTFTWYKVILFFAGLDSMAIIALDLGSMGKGQAWVNGHHIGRYWTRVAPKDGCGKCDYRGHYHTSKCATNCGNPTQIWYHIPRSWLQASNNLLVLFEETGGKPFEISVKSRSTQTICAEVSESHYPSLQNWSPSDFIDQNSKNKMTPEMHLQCDDGHTISSIEFASYGTPQGSCQMFSQGQCHAPNSLALVSKACQGKGSCVIRILNSAFGGDPCRGIVKTLAVEAKCAPSSTTSSSQL